jgi:hypothetical protein
MLRATAVGADLIVMPVTPVQEVNTTLNTLLNTSLNTSDIQEVAVGGYGSYTQYQKRLSGSAPQFNSTGNGSLFSNGFDNSFGNGWNSANGSLLHCRRRSSGSASATAAASLSAVGRQQQQQKQQQQKQCAAATTIQVTRTSVRDRCTLVVCMNVVALVLP